MENRKIGGEIMRITDIRFRLLDTSKDLRKMKAVVSVTFDEEIVIHDIKIIDGEKGPFIAMPSSMKIDPKTGEKSYRDIAHPIKSTTRDYLQREILSAYEIWIEEQGE